MRTWLLALALVAGPVHAQTGPDIVVTARPEVREEAKRLASAISSSVDGQLARITTSVCAASVGLPGDYDAFVAKRIAAAARAAGIAVDRPGCTPNIIAAFVEDGRALVAELDRNNSPLLNRLSGAERRRLLAERGPVRVISLTELRSRDGDRLRPVGPGGMTAAGGTAPVLEVRTASNLNPPTRVDINAALVLVDRAAMIGKTFGQVADHVAMRALAMTRDTRTKAGDDTILALFTPGATPPRGMTAFDTAYLRALYHGPANRTARAKVAEIARGIARGAGNTRAE